MKVTLISIIVRDLGTFPKNLERRFEEEENLKSPSTAKIDKDIEKTSGDLGRLDVSKTTVKIEQSWYEKISRRKIKMLLKFIIIIIIKTKTLLGSLNICKFTH